MPSCKCMLLLLFHFRPNLVLLDISLACINNIIDQLLFLFGPPVTPISYSSILLHLLSLGNVSIFQ